MIDVFKVGVKIGMSTNATQILSTMLAQLTGLHVAAGKLEKSLGTIRTAALGAGAAFVGWEIGKGLWNATKHAEALNHELIKLKTGARLNEAQTKDAEVRAFQTSRTVKGTSADENVKMTRELFGVFNDMQEANSLMPIVAQGSQVVRNFTDVQGVDLAKIAMKTLELRGHMTKDGHVDEAEFRQEFANLVRSIVASEGLVDQEKLYMATKQAGPAARAMGSDEFWGKFPAIINAMGAGPAGTAMNSFFKQFIGHTVGGVGVAEAMQDAGMLTKGKWRVDKRTHKVTMDQDAVPDQAGVMDHPITWLHEKLEALRHQKDKHGKPIDTLGVIQKIFQFASRATTARFINDVDANYAVIEAEEARYKRTPSPDVIAKEQNDEDLKVNIHNLTEAWKNFMAAVGGPGVPIAIGVIHQLTDALNYLQRIIIEHPEAAKDLFYLAGGISAMTMLGGGITLFMIAWSPFVTGIKLLVGIGNIAATGTAVGGLSTALGGLGVALLPFAVGGAAFLAITAFMDALHGWAGFGNKDGFGNMTGGPSQGAAKGSGYGTRPDGVAPMPGDSDFRIPLPPKAGGEKHSEIILHVDGKKLASIVGDYTANSLSRAPTGRSGADMRISPMMPGMSTAFG